jgi:putative membrane protein
MFRKRCRFYLFAISLACAPALAAQTGLSASDKKFLKDAEQGGLTEVELGKLASQKAESDAVRKLGERMVTDHTKVNQELSQLATAKGFTLATTLDPEHQKIVDRFSGLTGADFDREYLKQLDKEHMKDVSTFKREAKSAKDPDVRTFAQKTLPVLEEHMRIIRGAEGKGGRS